MGNKIRENLQRYLRSWNNRENIVSMVAAQTRSARSVNVTYPSQIITCRRLNKADESVHIRGSFIAENDNNQYNALNILYEHEILMLF